MGGEVRVEPVEGDGLVCFDGAYGVCYQAKSTSPEWIQLPQPPVLHRYYMVTEKTTVFLISADGVKTDVFKFDLINANTEAACAWKRVADMPIVGTNRAFLAASHGKIRMIPKFWNSDGRLLTYDVAEDSWSCICCQLPSRWFGSIALFLLKGRPLSLLGRFMPLEVVDESEKFWVSNEIIGCLLRIRSRSHMCFDVSTEFFFEKWTIAEYDIERDKVTGYFACEYHTKLMTAIMGSWFDGRLAGFQVQGTTAVVKFWYKGNQLVFKGSLDLTKKIVNWEQIALPPRTPAIQTTKDVKEEMKEEPKEEPKEESKIKPLEQKKKPKKNTIPVATDICSHLSLDCTNPFDGGLLCQTSSSVYYQSKQHSTFDRWIELPKVPATGVFVCEKKKVFLLSQSKEAYVFDMMDLGRESATWYRVADMPISKPQSVWVAEGKIYYFATSSPKHLQIYDIKSDSWKSICCNDLTTPTSMMYFLDGRPFTLYLPDGCRSYSVELLDRSGEFWVQPRCYILPDQMVRKYDVSTKFYFENWDVMEYDIITNRIKRRFSGSVSHEDWKLAMRGYCKSLRVRGTTVVATFYNMVFTGELDADSESISWRLVALPHFQGRVTICSK